MTKTTKRFDVARWLLAVMALAALALAAQPAAAQDTELAPEHLALARKYVDLTDKSAVYEVTLVQTAVEALRTIVSQNPEISTQVDAAITKTLQAYQGKKGDLLDQFARVYALRFTLDELQQIVAFYESPVGSKLATTNAEVNGDLQTVMKVFENNIKGEFYAKVKAELKAVGIDI